MKTTKILAIIFLLTSLATQAQVNLVGARPNPATGHIDMVKWQLYDSSSVATIPTILEGYLLNSSVFDAFNSIYYITGIAGTSGGLLSFNTSTNQSTLSPFTTFSNTSEIDMSTGKIYNLTAGSQGYITVNEYDITSGTDSVLGVINDPGIPGVVVDATGFDSNNGILYYVGYDGGTAPCLFSVSVREPIFTWSKISLITTDPENNITSVNYDNENDKLFALNAVYDASHTYIGSWVIEIDYRTGEVISRGLLDGYPYYLAGSSSFDQNTGGFMLVAFDANFVQKMILFDTYSNTYETGFVPDGVSEIVCDNYAYAQNKYGVTGTDENDNPDVTISPNPATTQFTVRVKGAAANYTVKIFDLQGKEFYSAEMDGSQINISTESLSKGIYLVSLNHDKWSKRYKLIVQ